jgi:hypothetical protein
VLMNGEVPEFPEEEEMLPEELENSSEEVVEAEPEATEPPELAKIEGTEVDKPEVPLASEFAVKKVVRLDTDLEEQKRAAREDETGRRHKRSGQGYSHIIG